MFQWQASEATSAIRLWKDPKLWVSWKLNSAQEWWHTVKRRQKYLLLLISWFCPSGLLYIIVILGAAMHKFDLWLCCCMAGWLRWQAVSVIVDRSSPTKHRLCYSMILAWWSSWVVSSTTSPNLCPLRFVQSNREASPGCSVHWLCRRQKWYEMMATFGIDEQVCLKCWLEPLRSHAVSPGQCFVSRIGHRSKDPDLQKRTCSYIF